MYLEMLLLINDKGYTIMRVNLNGRLLLYSNLKKKLYHYSNEQIETGIMLYCLSDYGCEASDYINDQSVEIVKILKNSELKTDLETVIEFFEYFLDTNDKNENGMIFTPRYIADYICKSVLDKINQYDSKISVIDPGCGCGIFLVSAAEYISSKFGIAIDNVIKNNIYGIDIDKVNVRRCCLILKLLSARNGGNYHELKINIICQASLKCSWSEEFKVDFFDFIVGNPPYINPHNMSKDTVAFLKENFCTTKNGVFNIFYAFIEQAMNQLNHKGFLGYIVPNNFLTIKSAVELRKFLQSYKYINRILDFGDNMVFKSVRTYNCILILSKHHNNEFEYCTMQKSKNISLELSQLSFQKKSTNSLDKNSWKLVDKKTLRNLCKIESQMLPIKDFIRTGIATLRDGVYMVDKDEIGYYKQIEQRKIYIEPELIKPIYKIPELKLHNSIDEVKRYIIFPYVKNQNGYRLIDESIFKTSYPQTYACLIKQKYQLDSRDKGRGILPAWYAYGRTQGLNKYGKKLLFPTFSNKPKFTYVDNEEALFCNGYAVFENDQYDIRVLQKILNSKLMDYYVSNTSYSIEGGYYCYQKKYIERFSLPLFTVQEIEFINKASPDDVDDFLWHYYGLE